MRGQPLPGASKLNPCPCGALPKNRGFATPGGGVYT